MATTPETKPQEPEAVDPHDEVEGDDQPTDDLTAPETDPVEQMFDEPDDDDQETPSGQQEEKETEKASAEDGDARTDKEEATTVDEFDPAVLGIAAELGIPESAARGFGSKEALQNHLMKTVNARNVAFQQQEQQRQVAARQPAPEPFVPTPFKLDMPKDIFDKELIAQVSAMNDHYAQQIEQLHKSMAPVGQLQADFAQVQQVLQAQATAAAEQQFDGVVNALGDKYEPLFGKGTASALPRGGPQHGNRSRLWQAADRIARGYASSGQQMPALNVLVDQALRVEFNDQQAELTRKQMEGQLRKRNGQFVARPSNRAPAKRSPDDRAGEYVETFYREHGVKEGKDL